MKNETKKEMEQMTIFNEYKASNNILNKDGTVNYYGKIYLFKYNKASISMDKGTF